MANKRGTGKCRRDRAPEKPDEHVESLDEAPDEELELEQTVEGTVSERVISAHAAIKWTSEHP
jgi:hypothetical protein